MIVVTDMNDTAEIAFTRKPHYVIYDPQSGLYYFITSKQDLTKQILQLLTHYTCCKTFSIKTTLHIFDIRELDIIDINDLELIIYGYLICKLNCLTGRVFYQGRLFMRDVWLIADIETRANKLDKVSK